MSGKANLAKRFDTFIFDWDGTLTRVVVLRKINEKLNPGWAYKKRKSAETIDKYSTNMPRNMNTLKGRAIRRHIRTVEAEHSVTLLADLSLYFFRPRLQDYSREVLDTLKKKGRKIALFTNGAEWRILKELSYLGIEDYFTEIVSAQDLNTLKPNPLGLQVITQSLRAKKERTIYIGDMVNDVEAAKYAGLHSGAVANGFESRGKLKGARPEYLFNSMESLLRAL